MCPSWSFIRRDLRARKGCFRLVLLVGNYNIVVKIKNKNRKTLLK